MWLALLALAQTAPMAPMAPTAPTAPTAPLPPNMDGEHEIAAGRTISVTLRDDVQASYLVSGTRVPGVLSTPLRASSGVELAASGTEVFLMAGSTSLDGSRFHTLTISEIPHASGMLVPVKADAAAVGSGSQPNREYEVAAFAAVFGATPTVRGAVRGAAAAQMAFEPPETIAAGTKLVFTVQEAIRFSDR